MERGRERENQESGREHPQEEEHLGGGTPHGRKGGGGHQVTQDIFDGS